MLFPQFNENARVKHTKTGHVPHSSKLVVILLFCCYLCCSLHCLCVNVYCTTATNPIAVNNYIILYHG